MKIKVKDVADLVGGKIIGDEECIISNVSKIQESQPGDLTFLYLPAYQKHLSTTRASAVLLSAKFPKDRTDLTYIEVDNPNNAFQKVILQFFTESLDLEGIDNTSDIDQSVTLGKNTAVGKNVVIEKNCAIGAGTKIFHNTVIMRNSTIGSNVLIYPNVTLRENTVVGDNVIIHSNTVVGSDGFGFSPRKEGGYDKIPQIGNVIIENDVEIGSNVSIDRAAIGSTIIKRGAKIDNLVQIAHNVIIGENTAISAQTGIAGSTIIGKNCIFGGQVGITGHIEIADGVLIGAQSGVSKSITKAGKYFGYPAKELGESLRQEAHIRSLPEYALKIKMLTKKIAELEKIINQNNKGNS